MKKSLIITLALVFVLGIAGTAFAAANPFVDVPAKHWAYDAVSKLAKAGILDGYGDGTYRGERLATRYELAQATAKAMARADKADAQMKALIDKLAVEFAAELNNLGVRVAKLEKNASSIKFGGDARLRYRSNYLLLIPDNAPTAYSAWDQRLRLTADADLNDRVQFHGRIAAMWIDTPNQDPIYGGMFGTGSSGQTALLWETGYFDFNPDPMWKFSIGRQALTLGNGLLADTQGYFDSVRLGFKNGKFSGFYAYGNLAPATFLPDLAKFFSGMSGSSAVNYPSFYASALNLQYQLHKDWSMAGGLLASHSDFPMLPPGLSQGIKNYFFGFRGRLNDVFRLESEYTWNTDTFATDVMGRNPHAWYAKLSYRGADPKKPGSWGAFVDYRDIDPLALPLKVSNLFDNLDIPGIYGFQALTVGYRGFGLGVDYTISKNAVLEASWQGLKAISPGSFEIQLKPYITVELNVSF